MWKVKATLVVIATLGAVIPAETPETLEVLSLEGTHRANTVSL